MQLKKMREMLSTVKTASKPDLHLIGTVVEMIKKEEEKVRRQQFNSLKKRIGK